MEKEKVNLGHLFHSFQGSILTFETGATSGARNAYPFGVHHRF
jgi:hypothetical protein